MYPVIHSPTTLGPRVAREYEGSVTNIDPPLLGLSQRLPPSNIAAEQALLGALLANNKAYERVSDYLIAEHFADPINGRIYQSIARRIDAGQIADPITLRTEFEHAGVLDEVGGTPYLAQLVSAMVGIINAGDYGRVIYDSWVRRQLIDIGETVVNNAFGAEPELDGTQQIGSAEEQLYQLATQGRSDDRMVSFETALTGAIKAAELAFQRVGHISGLSTGLRDLDGKTGGLHRSDLLILAGRPGMGKTALATKIAFGAARAIMAESAAHPANKKSGSVVIFSLEMSSQQLATRLLSEESRVRSDRIRKGEINDRDFDRFVSVAKELQALPLYIDDTPAITMSALRTRCRRLSRTKGLSLVVIDYLQLMRPSPGTRAENRVLEISMITQGLKALAKELDAPVLALSQLSRAVESREDKRPQLSDLRESGSIEQDADAVMFIYREEYYLQQREPKESAFPDSGKYETAMEKWKQDMTRAYNKAELLLEKQRHGPTGKIDLFFEGEFTRFADLDTVHGGDD
jgi:replicative DNA helicase